ncbi:MAG: CRISPR system precrRNA processing endoribonuclease RAMP protein Cas6 [Aggregatilineales bacterium]
MIQQVSEVPTELSQTHPMDGFAVQHLSFVVRAEEAVMFGLQPGTALRGALYNSLCNLFSPDPPLPNADIPLDPVRGLLEARDDQAVRGRDIPRAFAIEPPLGEIDNLWNRGQTFEFGISLFGTQTKLIPHIIRAVREMGKAGLGQGRGRFTLLRVDEVNPLANVRRPLMENNRVSRPTLTMTQVRVHDAGVKRNQDTLTLHFLTPTRLTQQGLVLEQPDLGVLLRRLLERAQALVDYYGPTKPQREEWQRIWEYAGQIGDSAQLVNDQTEWVEIVSHSRQRGRFSPVGGFVGQAIWQGEFQGVIDWLLWGQSLHVGKNTVKGDGWYLVR